MKKILKREKAITLIGLIVTIIILLILAGISIAQLTGNGLFEKAKLAKEETINTQDEENIILGDYEVQINKIINGNRNDGNSQFKNCNITISETGTITVQNIDKMATFAIIQDGKFKDITKNETYLISVPAGKTVEIYVIAIDENGNVYKSNTIFYTGKAVYLYNKENKEKWICKTGSGMNVRTTDEYTYFNWIDNNTSYLLFRTQEKINLEGYSRIGVMLSTGETKAGSRTNRNIFENYSNRIK